MVGGITDPYQAGYAAGQMYGAIVGLCVLSVIIFTPIAAVIGSRKGRTGQGVVLGLFLSFVGVIIIALLKPRPDAKRPADYYVDPFDRHQLRYFDGENWTATVSDFGELSEDEPVANPGAADQPAPTR